MLVREGPFFSLLFGSGEGLRQIFFWGNTKRHARQRRLFFTKWHFPVVLLFLFFFNEIARYLINMAGAEEMGGGGFARMCLLRKLYG